jgi:cell division septation protein DedD
VAKQDRHLTTEQLSAYLDGHLSPQELSPCDAHLNTCKQCQQTLAELRETVALLHALPQPTLPRSFLLPADISVARLAPVQPPTPLSITARRRRWPSHVHSMVRVVSTIAAVIGIAFLLSSLVGVAPQFGGSASTSSSTSAPVPAQRNNAVTPSEHVQPRVPSPGASVKTPSSPGTSTADQNRNEPTPKPTPAAHPANAPNPPQFLIQLFDLSTSRGRALLGVLLLVLGLIGIVLLRLSQSQRT